VQDHDQIAHRLLGTLPGKRVLDLGCAGGGAAVAFARAGATVLAVDASLAAVEATRSLADREDVRFEVHHADLAELAFLRADSIDATYSDGALAEVPDLARVFRQVHRVLRQGAPFVIVLPHPFAALAPAPTVPTFEDAVRPTVRSFSEVFTELVRAGFRVDTLLEPALPSADGRDLGRTILRARKEGV
jgi:SAM-dependent methyltransferase